MELKLGYKQTEVGVIPFDWAAEGLGSHVSINSGESPSNFHFKREGVPYFKVEQLNTSEKYQVETPYFFDGTRKVARGSLIFPKRGASILLNKIRIPTEESFMDTNLMTLTPREGLDGEYLYYALLHIQLWRVADTTSIPQINNKHINPLVIPLPPLPEQRAIAAALSVVDALISALDQLIAKKRDLKQAAMQQLLTGKQRLPSFNGEWQVHELGEGITLLSGQHVLAQHCNTQGDGVPYLTGPADFPDGTIQQTKFTEQTTTLCAPDDILVTVKGSGSGSLVVANAVYCISRQLMAIRVRDWDSRFIYYSLLQNASKIIAASTGLIPGLSRCDILEQPLPLPPTSAEQTAIATVLSDMDAELAALEQRRDKTRALKKGMMQELLTGRIRLV